MKYLIMINTKYPYRTGESFLESEIRETACQFDKILIFPVDTVTGDQRTRNVEYTNVQDFVFENEKPILRKVKNGIKTLFSTHKHKGSIKKRFYDAFFETSAIAQAKKIEEILDGMNFNEKDQIILYSYWFYIPARIVIDIKFYFQKRGIHTIQISRAHRFDIYENRIRPLPQRRMLLDQIDMIFACSKDGADYLKERYPEYAGKVSVSLLGTYDHGVGTYDPESIFSVVSCSRVTEIKRVHLILEAVAILQDKGYKICWTHIGDGPEMQRVRSEIEHKNMKQINLVGTISNTEVYNYYMNNSCSVFLNVSSSEGLPVSIMEATSFGIPAIATDVGGTREIVVDGITGRLLCDNPNAETVADAIEMLYKMDRCKYLLLRKTTREFWNKNFNAKSNYRGFINDIQNLTRHTE